MRMEEESGRSEQRRIQREQERERRRIRDRQRRQSMTVEQREKHLARRRRNYQLRRLRAENVRLGSQTGERSVVSRNETITVNEHQAVISVSGSSDQCNTVPHVQINQGQEKLIVEFTKSEGLEALAHKSAHFQRTLRLSHVRHLARTLNHSVDELTGNRQVVAAVVNKGDVTSNRSPVGDSDSGRSLQSLRLNRVKHLARTVNNLANSVMKEATGHSDQGGAEVQPKLPWGGDTAGN